MLSAGPKDGNIYEWQAGILGPTDSPYEGGIFHLEMKFEREYPFKPPLVTIYIFL